MTQMCLADEKKQNVNNNQSSDNYDILQFGFSP